MSNVWRKETNEEILPDLLDSYLQQQEVLSDWEISGDFRIWQRRMEEEPSFWFNIILALTFGFTLLTTDVAIGRKTRTESVECVPDDSPQMGRSWHSGVYHSGCDSALLLFHRWMGTEISGNLYHRTWGWKPHRTVSFTGYITSMWQPILWLFIYLLLTAFVVYKGVIKELKITAGS